MSYATSSFKISGKNEYLDSIGEYNVHGRNFAIVEDSYDDFKVYEINQDEELEFVEDEDIQEEVVHSWKEDTYGMNPTWRDDYLDGAGRITEDFSE